MPSNIEVAGAGGHPVNVFAKPMSYGQASNNGEFNKQDGSFPVDAAGNPETKGPQLVPYAFIKKAILDIRDQMIFQQMATTREMPKHSGRSMKMYKYHPVIDDANVNDQGISADGIKIGDGNLWGSSRDPGVIKDKMPWGREGGGRMMLELAIAA